MDSEDWEEVASVHNLNFPTNGRDLAKLKCKIQQMYQVKIPTGDPLCPPEIRMVKTVREKIQDKTEIDDGEGELLLQDPSFQGDNAGQLCEPVDDFSDGEDGGDQARAAITNNNRALTPINNNISQIASAHKSQKKS